MKAGIVRFVICLSAGLFWILVPLAADDRSRIVTRLDCRSEIGHREITLFANGTIRVREGLGEEGTMALGELGPEELRSYLRRLAEIDLSEVPGETGGVEGEWVERCRLELALGEDAGRTMEFSRYDALPLSLQRLRRILEELGDRVSVAEEGVEHLPSGYRPRPGDVLRRADGELFEVRGFTADGRGVELQGIDQPLTLYVAVDDLRGEFVALVSRRPD